MIEKGIKIIEIKERVLKSVKNIDITSYNKYMKEINTKENSQIELNSENV